MFESDGNVSIPMVANSKGYVTATWRSGNNGYRKWSDGYIEQWGRITANGNITFPTSFTTTNYNVTMSDYPNNDTWNSGCSSLTTTGMYINKANNGGCMWFACGY